MGDHEDSNRLIVKYCPRQTPEWQLPSAYNHCRHCEEKFKGKSHQHNCRLCGHLFCSMCTKKYHTPQDFKRKEKSGPVRVCLGCRDQALIRRQKVEDTPVLRPHQIISVQHGKVHIHPPTWVPENAYNHCFECRESTGAHPFFCRLCGEMFCAKCSIKLDVPNAFRKKRNKSGPVRCCIECRYKVYAKVELDETPLSKLKEQENTQRLEDFQMSYDNEGGRPQALTGSMAQFAQRIPNSPLRSSELANRIAAPPKSLQVYQRHHVNPHDRSAYNDQFLAQIEVPGDSNLVEIHERVMRSCSTLRNRIFYYICRNKPCFTEHWDMFSMKYFPQVVVAEGAPPGENPDEYAQAFQGGHKRAQPSQNHQQMPAGDSGPPPPNFPRQQSMSGHRVSNSAPPDGVGAGGPSLTHPRQLQQQQQQHSRPGSMAAGNSLGVGRGGQPARARTSMGGPPSMSRSNGQPSRSSTGMPPSSGGRGGPMPGGPSAASTPAAPGPVSGRKRQPKYADAIWVKSEFDYEAQTDTNMTIHAGQTLACFAHDPKEQWWFGESLDEKSKGWFPAAYVTECEAPNEDDDGMPKGGAGAGGPPPAPGGAGGAGPPQPPSMGGAGGPPPPPAAAAAGPPAAAAAASQSQYGGGNSGYPPQGPQGGRASTSGGYPPQAGRPPMGAGARRPSMGGRPATNPRSSNGAGYPPQPKQQAAGGYPSRQSSGYPPQPAAAPGGYQAGPPQPPAAAGGYQAGPPRGGGYQGGPPQAPGGGGYQAGPPRNSGYQGGPPPAPGGGGYQAGPPQWQQQQQQMPPPAPAAAGPPPPPGAMGGPGLW